MTLFLLKLIRVYQHVISGRWGFLNLSCKFYPSCSQYSYEAIEKFGIIRGFKMGLGRILRCHPWARGGYDGVPRI